MNGDAQKLFTPESVSSFTGLSAIVWVLSNTVRVLTNHSSKWIVFLISMLAAFISTYISNVQILNNPYIIFIENPLNTFFSILNACLLFLNSLGLQTTLTTPTQTTEENARKRSKIRWFDPW
jgi:hypothetical protein